MLDVQKFIWVPKIVVDTLDEVTTTFTLQYLPSGFGHTIGNAMRRIILWYSAGASVTAMKIKGVSHEYHTIDGVKESVLDMMLHFKKLRFTVDENMEKVQRVTQRFKWVGKYTADNLKFGSGIELLNEDVYLCEISDPSVELIFELRIEKGYGYYSLNTLRVREEKQDESDVNILLIDNDFRAVEYVQYNVEAVIDDFMGNAKDKLILEVKTISPKITAQALLSFAGEVLASYAKLFIFDEAYIDKSLIVDYYDIVEKKEKWGEDHGVKTIPIDALPLSERTRNALIKNDILYVEDLTKKRKSELMTMKWIGRKAVDEINDSLVNLGKSLD
jgi:DNA-directed RNA polymerase subunit alpha